MGWNYYELFKMDFNHEGIDGIAVRARELHERLGIKKDFTDWFKYHIKRVPLVEGRDFILLPNIGEQDQWGGHNKVDYVIPFDIAKQLCMMSGGEWLTKLGKSLLG